MATHHARFWVDDSFHSNLSFKVDLISIASSRRESHQPYVVFQKLKTSFHRNLTKARLVRFDLVTFLLLCLYWNDLLPIQSLHFRRTNLISVESGSFESYWDICIPLGAQIFVNRPMAELDHFPLLAIMVVVVIVVDNQTVGRGCIPHKYVSAT